VDQHRIGFALGAIALGLAPALNVGAAAAQVGGSAAWLDAPPAPWNVAGAPLPTASSADAANLDRCAAQERAPVGPDESQVAAARWRLEQYWPTQRGAGTVVVLGTSGYDGMCRPIGYNAFAFVDGRFAGTISPTLMYSRADGSLLETPTVAADGRVAAAFTRYAPQDPLCCPSRGRTAVTYRIDRPAAPVLVPERIVQIPPAPPAPATAPAPPAPPTARAPTQLPRTGATGPAMVLLAAAAALLAGLLIRGRTGKLAPSRPGRFL
jgi:hypothetical protein